MYGKKLERLTGDIRNYLPKNCVYLNAFETRNEAREGIGKWIEQHNRRLPHLSLADRTPYEACLGLPLPGYGALGKAT
ncbi:MAG TPA: hypothetical protein ENG87_00795 [Candidatus Pacearchaeota archaeon]|nr:hypothetical protein [Candidatus Pacearchaeota archaeon]